jgi:hypothetical protein
MVLSPVWSVDPELVDDSDRLAGREPCVCGVQWRTCFAVPAQPGYPAPSAEPAGAVKPSTTGPSEASREAAVLAVAGRRS